MTFYGSADLNVQLLRYLHDKRLLLVLDSFEHLLVIGLSSTREEAGVTLEADWVTLLAEILRGAPGVKVVVTSSERLNLRGEWIFQVHGLPAPPDDQSAAIESYGAVNLFVQSARRAQADFQLSMNDRASVVRICQLVQGLPLAIELAAAWTPVLTCAEIVDEIERDLRFFSSSTRDMPKRHHSMQAVFDHSWRLLDIEERAVLLQLPVFQGGFRRETAEQVAGATLALLSTLVNKSLLQHTPTGRYEIHRMLRQYLASKQQEIPAELETTHARHSDYYTALVWRLEQDLKSRRQPDAMVELGAEIENVRAAWRYAITRGSIAHVYRSIVGFWLFHEMCGGFKEAESNFAWAATELERVYASQNASQDDSEAAHVVLREYLLAHQAWFCMRLGRVKIARSLLEQAVVALRSLASPLELADAVGYLGVVEWQQGHYAVARELFLEQVALVTQINDSWRIGYALGNLGLALLMLGEYEAACGAFQKSLARYRALEDLRLVAVGLLLLATAECTLGTLANVRELLQECRMLSETAGDRWVAGMALRQMGIAAHLQGNGKEAVQLLRQSLATFRELDERWNTIQTLNALGAVHLALQDYNEAYQYFREALVMAAETETLPQILEAFVGLSGWLMAREQFDRALLLLEHVLLYSELSYALHQQAEELHAEVVCHLTSQQNAALRIRAEAQTLDEVLAESLHLQ